MFGKRIVAIIMLISSSLMHSTEFTILSQNILGPNTQDVTDLGFAKGDYGRISNIVEEAVKKQPTFLCFQEWDSTVWGKLKPEIKTKLQDNYTLVHFERKGQNGGVILYVKKELSQSIVVKGGLPLENNSSHKGACAYGIFNIQGNKVLVVSLHLSRANYKSSGQAAGDAQWQNLVALLGALIRQHNCAVVFVGDFNTFYEEVLNYTKSQVSNGLGMPISMYEHQSLTVNDSSAEFASIDHVLYSPSLLTLIPTKSWVGNVTNPYVNQQVVTAIEKIQNNARLALITKQYPFDHATIWVTFKFGATGPQNQSGAHASTGNNSQNSSGPEKLTKIPTGNEVSPQDWFLQNYAAIQDRINRSISSVDDLSIPSAGVANVDMWITDNIRLWLEFHANPDFTKGLVPLVNQMIKARKLEIQGQSGTKTGSQPSVELAQALELASCLKKKID